MPRPTPRPPRRPSRTAAALALVLLGGASPAARAQGDFPVERLRGTLDGTGIIGVESGTVAPHLQWSAAAWASWSQAPLVLYSVADGKRLGALVEKRAGAAVVASVGLFGRAQLGLELPFVLYQARPDSIPGATATPLPALSSAAFGDARIVPKVLLLGGEGDQLSLALLAGFTLPSGGAANFAGDKGLTVEPELALSRRWERVRVAANLGFHYRSGTALLDDKIGSELSAGLGAALRVTEKLELASTLNGAVSAKQPLSQANQTPAEWRAQAGWSILPGLVASLGGGVGLSRGWGTPDWRAFAALRFTPQAELPEAAEPPPPPPPPEPEKPAAPADSDGDGIVDTLDQCPQAAEDKDGFEDADGCPDLDNDQDGVPDTADKCPLVAEDKDGFQDDDGCPDPDNDQDGVTDAHDRCPLEAGPVENGGCPDTDRDGDKIVDRLDNCPDEPGVAANNGCKAKQLAVIRADKIEILESVFFKTDSDVIDKRSFALLDNVASVINSHPAIGRIRIEGHTDDQGKAAHNLDLSQRRAESVRKYLAGKQVAAERLVAKGWGQTRPIADNKTAAGRAQNRRVVFAIENAGDGVTTTTGGGAP